jgi:hypothetical protein
LGGEVELLVDRSVGSAISGANGLVEAAALVSGELSFDGGGLFTFVDE